MWTCHEELARSGWLVGVSWRICWIRLLCGHVMKNVLTGNSHRKIQPLWAAPLSSQRIVKCISKKKGSWEQGTMGPDIYFLCSWLDLMWLLYTPALISPNNGLQPRIVSQINPLSPNLYFDYLFPAAFYSKSRKETKVGPIQIGLELIYKSMPCSQ